MTKSDPLGDVSLTDFLYQAERNLYLQKSDLPRPIDFADSAFLQAIAHLSQERDAQSQKMFLLSHNAWRQGILTIASGGPIYARAILRNSLEAGLQGYLFARDTKMAKQWRDRGIHRQTERAYWSTRKQLGAAARAHSILTAENSELADSVTLLEGQLMDYHWFPSFIRAELDMDLGAGADDELHRTSGRCRQPDDQFLAWSLAARTAEAVLRVLCLAYPECAASASMEERLFALALQTLDLNAASETT